VYIEVQKDRVFHLAKGRLEVRLAWSGHQEDLRVDILLVGSYWASWVRGLLDTLGAAVLEMAQGRGFLDLQEVLKG